MILSVFLFFVGIHLGYSHYRWRMAPESRDSPLQRSIDLSHEHDLNQPGQCYCGVPNSLQDHATPPSSPDDDSFGGDPRQINFSDRIVGGDNTLLGEYPWQVSLLYQGVIQNHFCGGTLVSSKHVITAAHCTQELRAEDIGVALG